MRYSGPFGVQHDRDRQPQRLAHALDQLDLAQMLRVRAVGEVEPHHVHAAAAHRGERLRVLAGGADGTDDLGFSHNGITVLIRFCHITL